MRYVLNIEVDVDPLSVEAYKAEYPGFREEAVPELLFREAVAIWDSEGLLTAGVEPVLVQGSELAEASS